MFRGAFGNKTYQNWGTYKPGGFKEPYTSTGQAEDCGGSNFTQTVNAAWGWASASCSWSYVSVCRIQRKWRAAATVYPPWLRTLVRCTCGSKLEDAYTALCLP